MTLQQRAQKLFYHPSVDESLSKRNAEEWVKAVEYLGNKWILAVPVKRTTKRKKK